MAQLPDHLLPNPVGREPLDREVLKQHQRDRVLAEAIEVFAKRGYPGTTVDHIVAAAKIGVGSFYALFSGKEECFMALLREIFASGRARIGAAVPDDAPSPQRVCMALRVLLELIAAEPLRARVALVEAQTAGPAALELHRETIDGLVPELRRCRDHSAVGEELPATLEDASLHGVFWFLQQRIADAEADSVVDNLGDLAQIVLEPYVGAEETRRLVAAASSAASTA